MEYERAREGIAKQAFESYWETSEWELATDMTKEHWRMVSTQILSLVEIKSDNQSLPAYCYNSISRCVKDMLKPDSEGRVWIRVIPKPKRK